MPPLRIRDLDPREQRLRDGGLTMFRALANYFQKSASGYQESGRKNRGGEERGAERDGFASRPRGVVPMSPQAPVPSGKNTSQLSTQTPLAFATRAQRQRTRFL